MIDNKDSIDRCNEAVNIKPSEGDYCRFLQEVIRRTSDGGLICESCYIKCIHSSREPLDCLVKNSKSDAEAKSAKSET